jgi:hypothetical protein
MNAEELKALKKQIVAMGATELMQSVRCGFELEFQQLDGKTSAEAGSIDFDAEPDYGQLAEDYQDYNHNDDAIIEYISDKHMRCFVEKLFAQLYMTDIRDAACHWPLLRDALNDAEDAYREQWEHDTLESEPARYYPTHSYDVSGMPDTLELGNDSSVFGGEFRTVGGLKVSEFIDAMSFLEKLDLEVDERCSFHIHLSVPGVKHVYGKELQLRMMEYLVDNYKRWPACVKKRLDNTKFYKLQVSTDKYSMIHKHSQGTWEFRIFGGVTNKFEAYQCLKLACQALQYAYRCQLEYADERLNNEFKRLELNVEYILTAACLEGKTVAQVLKEHRPKTRPTTAA